MTIRASQIVHRRFRVVARGFDQTEVLAFLNDIALEIERLQAKVDELVQVDEATQGPPAAGR